MLEAILVAWLYLTPALGQYLQAVSLKRHDFGDLDSLEQFHELMGVPIKHINDWEDVSVEEDIASIQPRTIPILSEMGPYSYTNDEPKLFKQWQCGTLTGWSLYVCENMPGETPFWATGGPIAINYSSSRITNWLRAVARTIKAGRDVKNTWANIENTGYLSQRQDGNITDDDAIHFTLPDLLVGSNEPILFSQDAEDPSDANMSFRYRYIFSPKDQTIYYHGTYATYTQTINPAMTQIRIAKHLEPDYRIHVDIIRQSAATSTIASPECLARTMNWHIDARIRDNRYACVPLSNRGQWNAVMHVVINRRLETINSCQLLVSFARQPYSTFCDQYPIAPSKFKEKYDELEDSWDEHQSDVDLTI